MPKKDLITCKTCEKEMAYNVSKCPHCGGRNWQLNFRGLWWKIPVIIIGLYFLLSGIASSGEVSSSPNCDSANVRNYMKEAIQNHPATQLVKVRVYNVSNGIETSRDEVNGIINCYAKVSTSDGGGPIPYEIHLNQDGSYKVVH